MNKFDKFKSFIITAIVTSIVVIVLCFIIELALLFKCENYITKLELNMANLVKFATIDQLEKRLKNEPTNHVVMIKLAKIRDELGDTNSANKLYLSALKHSNRSNYALYSYALFCAKNNLYIVAASLAEEILGNNKKTIRYKCEIYEAIANNMLKTKQYQAAVKAYQISYKYAKNLKDNSYFKKVQNEYATSYIKLADELIEQNKVTEAITALNNSVDIKETQVALYKLGLLYIETDKKKAQKYIETVFNKEPYIVNPYIYNSLLQDLIQKATDSHNQSALNYYSVKYDRFKNAMEDIYLYKEDIIISNAVVKKEKEDYILSFDLKNNTKNKIDQLYLYIDIFLNTKHYKITKKVVRLAHTLGPFDELKDFTIVLPQDMDFVDIEDHNYLIIKFYAKKSVKAPNTLVKITALNF